MRKCVKSVAVLVLVLVLVLVYVSSAQADVFGTGGNQFSLDFVPISGDVGGLGSWGAGSGYTFTGVNRDDYRMGTFEVTNDQWSKFKAELGVPVTGGPSDAYNGTPVWTGTNVPTNNVSWYESAQFVNWLNTSKGYQPAYKFTGTQGTSNYTLDTWSLAEADNGTNLYRNKDAMYYLPTEDEWVKAAYWNGASLQEWATVGDVMPVEDVETNYDYETGAQPWDVGSGIKELNGTFDMMGNLWEIMESPWASGDYGATSERGVRGGAYSNVGALEPTYRYNIGPNYENPSFGFRVASEVPEPCSLVLLSLGGAMLLKRKRG